MAKAASAIGRDKDQGRLVGALGQVAIHRVVAKIGLAAHKPFRKWWIAVVTNLLRLNFPVHQLGLLSPKSITIVNRARVEISKIAHESLLFTGQINASERKGRTGHLSSEFIIMAK